jgi:hypothetical protein
MLMAAKIAGLTRTDFLLALAKWVKIHFTYTLRILTMSLAVANPSVVNASPLIFFSRAQKMDLLHQFVGHLLVPEPA